MAILETERLTLRELTPSDQQDLAEILQDAETMVAYEGPFSDAEVTTWLEKQLARYANDGIGLWAVIRKADGAFLGQCGLTWQDTGTALVPEIGYLFKRRYWGQGYASEAAIACREYAFTSLGFPCVYSIIRDTNVASIRVAERNGMVPISHMVKHYRGIDMPHTIYQVCRKLNK